MSLTLAFDVYGTLIDTNGVVSKIQQFVGADAENFSRIWRDKQLEYSFRRGLMQNYADFSVCTRHALDYTCLFYKANLTEDQKSALIENYRTLPAFKDVQSGLSRLNESGFRLYAFSNGSADAVDTLLAAAGIRDLFLGVISTDDLKSFKPNPAVYCHFLRQSNAPVGSAWLVSSNPFDVIGAVSAGMRSAWVRRSEDAIFDPWGIEPTMVVGELLELDEKMKHFRASTNS
jgi:2-haloacid dehalogenase